MDSREMIKRLEIAKRMSSEEAFRSHGYDIKLRELKKCSRSLHSLNHRKKKDGN